MATTNTLGITLERVYNKSESDVDDLMCSTICTGILWKPIACQKCETHFCKLCITKWFEKHPNQCPMRCDTFVERNCSKIIAKQLARLQIFCINRENGCSEIVVYEALEKHELECDYQLERCPVCRKNILRKDYQSHQSEYHGHVRNEQQTSHGLYPTNTDVEPHHSDTRTVKDEIWQLQLQQNRLTQLLIQSGVIENDNDDSMRRVLIQSTSETGKLPTSRIIKRTGSATIINDGYLCWQCKNVAWEPLCCKNCSTILCKACSPWTGAIGAMVSFFTGGRPHGKTNCKQFEAGMLSKDFSQSIDQAAFHCAYSRNGCPEQLAYQHIVRHEEICSYQMLPCKVCRKLLPKQSSSTGHTTRACFQHMYDKSPMQIQAQFMILLQATEKADAENRLLQAKISTLEQQIRALDETCVKKKIEETQPSKK